MKKKERTGSGFTSWWKHKRPFGKRVENKKIRKNARQAIDTASK